MVVMDVFNSRGHLSLGGKTPIQKYSDELITKKSIENYVWKSHCNGLFQTPVAVGIWIRTAQAAAIE